jgi:hypothetical protein
MRTDLRGQTPESHDCVDCGVNTAPGVPNRVELEAAFNSGVEEVPYTITNQCEMYMVRDRVWEQARMAPMGGCLCIGCLEKRLGRRLRPKDFLRNHAFSVLPGTSRLLQRRGRAQGS